MALRIVYRSHGGENQKNRPAYYSKVLGLVSLLRAAEGLADIVFVNDGRIPDDRLRLMEAAGTVVSSPGQGMRASYRTALRIATDGRWGTDDVVWFSEDDYLYRPDAFSGLLQASQGIPEADYFALYGLTPANSAPEYARLGRHRPAGWDDGAPWTVAGQQWVRIESTASTFGARVPALVQDLGIFRFCMVPHRNQLRDHDTMLLVQGFEPYRYGDLGRSALGLTAGPLRSRARGMVMAPFELASNLRSHRRPSHRRLLVAADPNLATHMETGWEGTGRDWAALAGETTTWGVERGVLPGSAG